MTIFPNNKIETDITVSIISSGNQDINSGSTSGDQEADFETAISATTFGKFNYCLYLSCLVTAIAFLFSNSSTSFILSEAQCDLELTLENKGMLNAIPYLGMISSGLMWGTIADKYGRRIVLLCACSLDTFFNFFGAHSRSYWMFLAAKYCSGFTICGTIGTLMTYLSEFHHSQFRPKLIGLLGIYYGMAKLFLPILAWAIIPLHFHFVIVEGIIEYKSWQVFLIVCCTPAILSAFIHYSLPETPKFLMTQGKYDEALELFRKIYTRNTGKPENTFPISRLKDTVYEEKMLQVQQSKNSKYTKFFNLFREMGPLFTFPSVLHLVAIAGTQYSSLLGAISLRLWLPQLFTTMDLYSQTHNETDATVCEMLDYSLPSTQLTTNNTVSTTFVCSVPDSNATVYLNTMIVPVISVPLYILTTMLISKLGKKSILVIHSFLGGIFVLANYWSKSYFTTVILSSIFIAFIGISSTIATSIGIELFPTNLRATATLICTMIGRFGPLTGNIVFPYLLYAGCLPPFLFIAAFSFLCTLFSLTLPGTENKRLK